MTILKSNFERFSIVSNNTFDDVVADFVVKIGHPAMAEFHKKLAARKRRMI